jgi:trans-aconitate methyltransferase
VSNEDIEDWNRVAARYSESAHSDHFINRQFKTVLWDSLGDIRGIRILDLGCGPGWLSRQLYEAGAQVLGIDGSAELIKTARTSYPDIQFLEHDLCDGLPSGVGTFTRVVANMVLMDLPDLSKLMHSVREALEPGGKFIFTMPHPCFFNRKSHRDEAGQLYKKVTGYLKPETWRIEGFGGHNHYHRSLTFYFDHLRANQLAVTRLYEPKHFSDAERAGDEKEYYENIPIFILIEATAL